jgi:hypothetical protein
VRSSEAQLSDQFGWLFDQGIEQALRTLTRRFSQSVARRRPATVAAVEAKTALKLRNTRQRAGGQLLLFGQRRLQRRDDLVRTAIAAANAPSSALDCQAGDMGSLIDAKSPTSNA